MGKTKKILLTVAFIIIFILLGNSKCKASGDLYLKNLNFDVQINSNGSMDVIETWNISIEETNTLFKTFKTDKTKYTSISNVQVSDITSGTDKRFEQINELMYHVTKNCYYGLMNDDGNFEIAWGVGLDDSSATRTYKISYTVNDAIAKYSDYAELYWQLVGSDFEIDSKNVTGTITLPERATSKDDIKVWGHTEDLNGEIYTTDLNKIEFEVTDFDSGRYIEIRTLFPTEIISSSGRSYSKDILEEVVAEETEWANAANLKRQRKENTKKVASIIFLIICTIVSITIIKKSIETFKKASKKQKLKPTIDVKYYREMPRNNATPSQALFVYKNSISDFTAKEMGRIFSATLLNLSLKKYIEFEMDAENKKNITIKILKKESNDLQRSEKEILEYILDVAKDKNEVTVKEIKKYMERYATGLISTKDDIERSTKKELEQNGIYDKKEAEEKTKYAGTSIAIIFVIIVMVLCMLPLFIEYIYGKALEIGILALIISTMLEGIASNKYCKKFNPFTEKGLNEIEMWKGLKKYMEDFSMLDKREVPELAIWEEFLVYATVFGIADKVLKQLKIVYKEIGRDLDFDTYGYMYLMMNTDFSSSFSNSISSAFTSAYSSNYSSGSGSGGGFSGGGGGGRWPEEVEEEDNTSNCLEDGAFGDGGKKYEMKGVKMNIIITKNINEANCITHSGTFHADEIFATLILSKIMPQITLIRLQELREKVNENVIVYDIGGGKFDHHQLGGNGQRQDGVKYAACGLIWKEYGKELLKKYGIKELEYVWNYIDKNLIQFIDANDNGQLPKLPTDYRNVHISHIIGLFNPKWDEEVDSDEKFMKALALAEVIFDEFLQDTFSKVKAKDLLELAIDKEKNGIMILDKFMPWKEFLLNSDNEKAEEINFVVFPSKRGGYNVYAVPKEIGSFENRKSLPVKWRGLRDENLQKVTGVKTARFCHNAGFICSAETKEDAIELALKANY